MNLRLRFIPIVLTILLASCTGNSSSKSSSSAKTMPPENEIKLVNSLSQEEEQYLIFFHSETCNHCKEIMGDVISFAEENIIKTYFLNISDPDNNIQRCTKEELTVGIDKVEDLRILGTPTIVKVENGVTTKNEGGKEKCLTLLAEERKALKE